MGQASSSAGGARGKKGLRETTDDGIDHQDYYGLLELDVTCDENEIKKAYRRLALRWHPDKNPDNAEAAAARFRLIGAAHEVLSDPQERAWYDGHREALLRGETGDDGEATQEEAWDEKAFQDFRSGGTQPSAPGSTSAGLTARHIMRFLDPTLAISLATAGPKADVEGFFGTYRRLFERIAAEDAQAAPYPGEAPTRPVQWPSFGYSHTAYVHRKGEDVPLNQTPARDFYNAWAGYQTTKSFSWKDGWKLSEAPDRRVKRLMDKENRQAREAARREYNDVVRSLVTFLRKRDPRFKAHLAAPTGASSSGAATPNATPQEMARRRAEAMAKRQAELENAYVPQAWAQQASVEIDSEFETSEEEDDDGENDEVGQGSNAGSAEQDDESNVDAADFWECVACDKTFQTRPAWENHERSKKHKTELRRLQREMRKEDKELGLDDQRRKDDTLREAVAQMGMADTREASDVEEEEEALDATLGGFRMPRGASSQPQMSKKARQKLKKRQKATGGALDEDGYYAESIAPVETSASREQAAGGEIADDVEADDDAPAPGVATPHDNGTATPTERAALAAPKSRKSRRSQNTTAAATETCNVCKEGFDSRSKLFVHVRDTGHARAAEPDKAAKDEMEENGPTAGRKGKKKGKRRGGANDD